jgi:hypothetical protein
LKKFFPFGRELAHYENRGQVRWISLDGIPIGPGIEECFDPGLKGEKIRVSLTIRVSFSHLRGEIKANQNVQATFVGWFQDLK